MCQEQIIPSNDSSVKYSRKYSRKLHSPSDGLWRIYSSVTDLIYFGQSKFYKVVMVCTINTYLFTVTQLGYEAQKILGPPTGFMEDPCIKNTKYNYSAHG